MPVERSPHQRIKSMEWQIRRLNRQIGRLAQENRRLANLVIEDPLIKGCLNRNGVLQKLENFLAIDPRLRRLGTPPSSALGVDLDNFKWINDTLGHRTGDRYLKTFFAAVGQELKREADFVGRRSGDEFFVFLHQADLTGAGLVAERIRQRVPTISLTTSGPNRHWQPQTVSIGVTRIRPDDSPELIMTRAAEMAEIAKRARNTVYIEGDPIDHLPPSITSLR